VEIDPQTGDPRLPQRNYIGYLRKLEEVLIQTLADYGIEAMRVEGDTGVWVPGDKFPAKIASIGIKVDARGISRHGFALNINPDMSYWDGIIACGLENQAKASISDYLNPVPGTQEVAQAATKAFVQVFECQLVWLPQDFT
jgi:lipoate-protein ligase B